MEAASHRSEAIPKEILERVYQKATSGYDSGSVTSDTLAKVTYICQNEQNRAGVRLLMSCLLAKVHRPTVDVRNPYTESGASDSFSGRTYDEHYIARFVNEHELPCNSTTAFLTPALRNLKAPLSIDTTIVGRPAQLYKTVLELLNEVYLDQTNTESLLVETVHCLIEERDNRAKRLQAHLQQLQQDVTDIVPLSAEGIVNLIQSQMKLPHSSRLPVLIVAAAYQAAFTQTGEKALPLNAHNAADKQTRALGDVELSLIADDEVVASYEMKDKAVTRNDIDNAVAKVTRYSHDHHMNISHYVFITTHAIEREVADYAESLYNQTGGIEFVILDCIGFLRYYLHLFHRLRLQFVEAFQELLLAEPNSGVSNALKESFLAARRVAEIGVEDV